jgi:Kef-type K+ transport system membrane component KefB
VAESATVSFLAQFGFLVLMFIAGMEIDFESIRHAGRRALMSPLLASLGIGAIALGVGYLRGLGMIETLVLGAVSVGMPLAVLQETGHIRSTLGRYVMLTGSVGEFLCIIAITGVEIVGGHGTPVEIVTKVLKILVLFAVSAFAVRAARALVWWYPGPFARLVDHQDVAELGVRVGLLLMLGFVVMSTAFGVEPILGAFIAGALVAFVLRQKHVLEVKIAAVGHGFFIPIFFVVVGLRFDPGVLDLSSLKRALVLSGFAFAAKLVPSVLFSWRELGLRERVAAGSLLSAPLTLVVAIAAIGHELGRIDARESATLVLVGMIVSVVLPILFKALAGAHVPAAGAAPDATSAHA